MINISSIQKEDRNKGTSAQKLVVQIISIIYNHYYVSHLDRNYPYLFLYKTDNLPMFDFR
jgi:hypothetical protein